MENDSKCSFVAAGYTPSPTDRFVPKSRNNKGIVQPDASDIGAPNWIRTSGPQIRNLMLYPAELWVHAAGP